MRPQVFNDFIQSIENHGFFLVGLAPLIPDPEFHFFKKWLDDGRHGEMRYLERYLQLRQSPKNIDPRFKFAVVLGLSYGYREKLPQKGGPPKIAQYARFEDYHRVFWTRGKLILSDLHALLGQKEAMGRVLADSAPVLERSLAIQAGGAFRGKNSCVISPQHGSLFFIGELLTACDLSEFAKLMLEHRRVQKSKISKSSCGSCKRCQVHCPTGALDTDFQMDARRCLAYWTIENRGPIPIEYWPHVAKYYFGCDICQLVCPFNRILEDKYNPHTAMPLKVRAYPEDLEALVTMDQKSYEKWFGGTPLTRAKREGLMRNALIALWTQNKKAFWRVAGKLESVEGTHPVILATIGQAKSLVTAAKSPQIGSQ